LGELISLFEIFSKYLQSLNGYGIWWWRTAPVLPITKGYFLQGCASRHWSAGKKATTHPKKAKWHYLLEFG
jgi:hypothetical protein